MFDYLKKKFSSFIKKTFSLGAKIKEMFIKTPPQEHIPLLEKLFYEADLGVTITNDLINTIKKKANDNTSVEELLQIIKQELLKELLPSPPIPLVEPLHIIMCVGPNGYGKTTSVAKLAHYYQMQNKKVIVAAADTFRAAALEQLEKWSEKLHFPLIKSQYGSDPAAVVYDAITAALNRHCNILIIDTAGRQHTNTSLMKELEKIRKTTAKLIPTAPHETILILDATIGQNGLEQAKIFHDFLSLGGIFLTKLDGTAKGGTVLAIQKELNVPVKWIGTGEEAKDIQPFEAESFINALLEI
jgi:fused signal recognition particle receptor